MSLAELNGIGVTGGRLTFGLEGAWSAELTLAGGASPVGACVLSVDGFELVGTASSAADEGGQVSTTVLAGAGGLEAAVDALHYKPGVTRRSVVLGALGIGGETLSPVADAAILDESLGGWMRARGTVGEALRRALAGVAAWRHLPDGTVWVGAETWPAFTGEARVESEEPTQQALTVAVETIAVLPGVTFAGQRISAVEYTLEPSKLRARLRYGGDAPSALDAAVRRAVAAADYSIPFVATVVGQNGDGTLELRSGDRRFADMSRIPIRCGVPGVVVAEVPTGSVAIVEFENGDPARAVVTGWLSGSATRLAIDAEVILGGGLSVTTHAAVAELVKAELQAMVGVFNGHTHSVSGAVTGVPAAPLMAPPGDVASPRVKVAT